MREGWSVRCRYRKGRVFWTGQVFECPPFVDAFVDDVKPVLVAEVVALTERRVRRKLARALWRRTHPDRWIVKGVRRAAA